MKHVSKSQAIGLGILACSLVMAVMCPFVSLKTALCLIAVLVPLVLLYITALVHPLYSLLRKNNYSHRYIIRDDEVTTRYYAVKNISVFRDFAIVVALAGKTVEYRTSKVAGTTTGTIYGPERHMDMSHAELAFAITTGILVQIDC